MRYVDSNHLCEGMRLARALYHKSEVILAKGVVLNQPYIAGIQRYGYPGVYIEDGLSSDIQATSVIRDELRERTARCLGKIMCLAEMDGSQPQSMPDITAPIKSIVDEICSKQDVMVNMLDLAGYDSYTYSHCLNVSVLSIVLGSAMGLSRSELVALGCGALLHDIGKIRIDKDILQKNGPLTDEEFDAMKNHPQCGYDYISANFQFPSQYYDAILDHHEKFDGTGYPNRKKGKDISLFGRICSVADVYDALTSKRPYRDALPSHECVEYILGGSDTQFDPEVVSVFSQRIAPYPAGVAVALSNGWEALVVRNYVSCSLRPRVRVYQQDGTSVTPFEISLKDDPRYLNVTITGLA